MKREGCQHGMVLTYQMMPPPWGQKATYRMINRRLDDPPTAGMFSTVSSKPTNHSKFTSRCSRRRCRGCHEHPASKSKEKAKGTHKTRNGSDFGMVSSRVVDFRLPRLQYSGFSATGFLDHLDDVERNDLDVDVNVNEDEDGIVKENGLMGDPVVGSGQVKDDIFCDLGAFLEHVYEDEGWCLVG